MAQVPAWLLGRHVTAVAVIPQTAASDGTLSAGVSQSLVGQLDEISIDYHANTEEINAMDKVFENNMLVTKGTSVTLHEILKSNGTNLLAALWNTATYAQFTCTRGGQAWSFYGIITSYSEGMRRGKSTASMTLAMVDPNTSNPTYT